MIDSGIAQIVSAAITVIVPIAAYTIRRQLQVIHMLVNSQLSDAMTALRTALVEVAILKAELDTLHATQATTRAVSSCPTATELASSRR